MIYITGDTHGSLELSKLNAKNFPQQKDLTKNDYVIICGDFGLIWNNNGEDLWWQNWLNNKPWTTLFICGNHENFDLLYQYQKIGYLGGTAHKISDSIYHLSRGQVFDIEGKKIFTMGGAQSQDRIYRKKYLSWWPQEMPSYQEYEDALYNLERNNWKVDYIVTHCAPSSIQQAINSSYSPNVLTIFFEEIAANTTFKTWYFGHYHKDFKVDKFHCVYKEIIPIY